ncbi:uncharacterized protein LOC132613375 [Lycium barbarum]|uniref:uncharacterized protein LOC132613375 n=1 Tax=Lycium barbarum TaxID=112863 RepID=UPI00293F145B|nr:uncharacterized protein LOC132613375 [Lycium barbarum]
MRNYIHLFGLSCIVNQLSQKQSPKNAQPSSSSLPLLNIRSSLRIRHDKWYIPSSYNLTQPQALYRRKVKEEILSNHIYLTSSVVLSYDRFYREISKLIGSWNVTYQDQRDSIVESTMRQVRSIAESNKGHRGALELSVDVKLVCHHVLDARILFPEEELLSQYGMVPASKSSMELLKKTKIDEENNKEECMVCLEELVKKEPDHDILSMPCSHMFHGECIAKWLETSHYCPICRYEMPMDEEPMVEQTNN